MINEPVIRTASVIQIMRVISLFLMKFSPSSIYLELSVGKASLGNYLTGSGDL